LKTDGPCNFAVSKTVPALFLLQFRGLDVLFCFLLETNRFSRHYSPEKEPRITVHRAIRMDSCLYDNSIFSLGVMQPGREANHSPPSSAEVKNAWSYTSTPAIRLHGMVLSKTKHFMITA
jgi:hypothetical protein